MDVIQSDVYVAGFAHSIWLMFIDAINSTCYSSHKKYIDGFYPDFAKTVEAINAVGSEGLVEAPQMMWTWLLITLLRLLMINDLMVYHYPLVLLVDL